MDIISILVVTPEWFSHQIEAEELFFLHQLLNCPDFAKSVIYLQISECIGFFTRTA
jgi:hypothetical protein